MGRPAWVLKLVKALYPQRFRLARLTQLPLVGNLTHRLLFTGDQVVYIPRLERIPIQTGIRMDNIAVPTSLVEHFIKQTDDLFLLHSCVCRSANDCQSYPIEIGCLFLGKAVHKINPAYGRLVGRGEALSHLTQARRAGLVHTIGRSKIDAVLLGAAPSNQLLTICHCCPCCCMWNTLPDFHATIANTVQRMPGIAVSINESCTGCSRCTRNVCFVDAIQLVNGRAEISDACRGCGRCLEFCPQGAIEMCIQDTNFVDETILRIASLVDLS